MRMRLPYPVPVLVMGWTMPGALESSVRCTQYVPYPVLTVIPGSECPSVLGTNTWSRTTELLKRAVKKKAG